MLEMIGGAIIAFVIFYYLTKCFVSLFWGNSVKTMVLDIKKWYNITYI